MTPSIFTTVAAALVLAAGSAAADIGPVDVEHGDLLGETALQGPLYVPWDTEGCSSDVLPIESSLRNVAVASSTMVNRPLRAGAATALPVQRAAARTTEVVHRDSSKSSAEPGGWALVIAGVLGTAAIARRRLSQ